MTLQTPQEKWTKWRLNRIKNDGWKRVQVFVPAPCAEQIKALIRKFKYENPTLYKK